MMKKEQLGAIQKKLAISFKENALRVNFCSHKNAGCKRLFPVFPKFFRDTLIQGRFGGRSSRTCRFSRGKTRLHYNCFVYMIILKFRISKFSTLARLIITYLYFYNMSTFLCYEKFPLNLFLILAFGIEGLSNLHGSVAWCRDVADA